MIDKLIFEKIEEKLLTLSWPKLVTWKKIRLMSSDFRDNEIPCIQFYDQGQIIEHETRRLKVSWSIGIELILKSQSTGALDVGDLFEKRQDIEQKMGEFLQLGIQNQGMINIKYVGNAPDYVMINPFFVTRLDFVAEYYKPYLMC